MEVFPERDGNLPIVLVPRDVSCKCPNGGLP